MPHKLWAPAPKPHGRIVFGLSPRARDNLTQPTKARPWLTQLLTSFVHAHFPHHKFSCVAVSGGKLQVHQDFATEGLSVVCSGSGDARCGFWISDASGQDFEEFDDHFIPGVVVDLSEGPLEFDAKAPHCSYINSRLKDQQTTNQNRISRISIAAFHLKRTSVPHQETIEALQNLGSLCLTPSPTLNRDTQDTRFLKQRKLRSWTSFADHSRATHPTLNPGLLPSLTLRQKRKVAAKRLGELLMTSMMTMMFLPRLIGSRRPYRWWPKVMS